MMFQCICSIVTIVFEQFNLLLSHLVSSHTRPNGHYRAVVIPD